MLTGSRLFCSAWKAALSEYHRVLKPTGHLQLVDVAKNPIQLTKDGIATPAIAKLQVHYHTQFNRRTDYIRNGPDELPEWLSEAGFRDIRCEVKEGPRLGRKWGGELGAEALENSVTWIRTVNWATGEPGDMAPRNCDELVEAYRKEAEDEGLPGLEFFFITARK
ncbi:hypothetical protein AAF712_002547 [Marasmius tenuissimus]|uniref:Methyltransferase type 11 domain-containing protein n=1 Tax=Marasmius tenuissimus TaxID=585030 RepID=A0ABR3A9U1_9AGAR